jgi:cation diffusion facilitator CzcD-associated flavoprotein CzcO
MDGTTQRSNPGLDALAREIARAHALLNYPGPSWTAPVQAPDGGRALDVAIVGAGMCGIALAHALKREAVHAIRLFDAAPSGEEGPWLTFARMETLRSPKHLTSPDLGLPALTFRAWYEAQYGIEGWNALYKIPTRTWHDYLQWLRVTLDLPVVNRVEVKRIERAGELLRLDLSAGAPVYARKIVLATGRGLPKWPSFLDRTGLAPLVAHSGDAIDFERLAGKRVAVLGGGAAAFDNAACALEAGARSVAMYIRRPHLPQINKFKSMGYPGFQRGFARLPDEWRWRLMRYAFAEQVPPPHESVLRCTKHPAFALHVASPWRKVEKRDGALAIHLPARVDEVDFAIVCTGFGVDPAERPELAAFDAAIARWGDVHTPPPDEADAELARFPYLDGAFRFAARPDRDVPRGLHCFNFASTLSHGLLSGDIPALAIGATRLAHAIVEDLFVGSVEHHHAALLALDDRELEPTPYSVPRKKGDSP